MGGSGFRAGVGRVDATPPLTAPHASWGAQVHVLPDGVEAPLWASALVVDDGTTMAAWIDLDVVIITRAESDAIREAVGAALGIPASHVRASVTHNHAGPPPSVWNWTNQGQAALDGYFAMLPEYAAGAARAALGSMRPARVGAGSGESRVAMNRRETAPDGRMVTGCNPGGLIDPEVLVGRIDDLDGSPIAAIVGYTMHPTTLGPPNRLISPDWPGHLKRTVESLTGAMCFFAQGATGNVGPGPQGFTDDVGVVRRLGAQVGCEAARVYLSLSSPAVEYVHDRVQESGAPLGVWKAVPQEEPEPAVGDRRAVGRPAAERAAAARRGGGAHRGRAGAARRAEGSRRAGGGHRGGDVPDQARQHDADPCPGVRRPGGVPGGRARAPDRPCRPGRRGGGAVCRARARDQGGITVSRTRGSAATSVGGRATSRRPTRIRCRGTRWRRPRSHRMRRRC